jgi:hypothetical protein
MFKHLIFLIVFCNVPLLSISQIQPPFNAESEIERIDLKLEKFRSQHQQGAFITLLGGIIATVPSITQGKPIMSTIALGTFVSALGVVTSINSYKYLRYKPKETPTNR